MSALAELLPIITLADLCVSAVAIGFALSRRRGFSSTIAWIAVIAAVPFLGALAFFTLANPVIRRARRRRQLAAQRVRVSDSTAFGACAAALGELPAHVRSVFALASRLSGMAPTDGNRLALLTNNAGAFSRIEEALASARSFIWAEYYIINDDDTGRRFLELLTERARAGVEVKLLYDAVGSARIDAERVRALQDAGGQVEVFLPVNPLRRRWAVHLRNHRKIVVVDGELGFTGGMNIGDEYSGRRRLRLRRRRRRPWRDTHLALRGPAVRDLAEIFAEDWCFAVDTTLEVPPAVPCEQGRSIVAAIPSGPDQEHNATGLVYFAGIASATERCYITSPYFIPDDPTLQALMSAALRGVDVRVVVPRMSDVPLLAPAMRSYYPRLVDAGVRIFEYLPRVLHAKSMVVDGSWGLIGSPNLDIRSFRLNFEASVMVHDRGFARVLENQFRTDLKRSREVTPESLAQRSWLEKMQEGAAQLLSPIL